MKNQTSAPGTDPGPDGVPGLPGDGPDPVRPRPGE